MVGSCMGGWCGWEGGKGGWAGLEGMLANQTTGQRVAAAQGPRIQWPPGSGIAPTLPILQCSSHREMNMPGRARRGREQAKLRATNPSKELFAGQNAGIGGDRAQETSINGSRLARRRAPSPRRP